MSAAAWTIEEGEPCSYARSGFLWTNARPVWVGTRDGAVREFARRDRTHPGRPMICDPYGRDRSDEIRRQIAAIQIRAAIAIDKAAQAKERAGD